MTLLLPALALAATAWGSPEILHSTGDDGDAGGGIVQIEEGQGAILHLYMGAGPAPSAPGTACRSGAGDEVCAWEVAAWAEEGVVLQSFEPATGVVWTLQPHLLRVNGGDARNGQLGRVRLGTLVVASRRPGALWTKGRWVDARLVSHPLPSDVLLQARPEVVDRDADGVLDSMDNCPNVYNAFQTDSDGDGVGDACDLCREVADAGQADGDGDGFGDRCDCDLDGDGFCTLADFNRFLPDFVSGRPAPDHGSDMDGDGFVTLSDFNLFLPGFVRGRPGPSRLGP